MDQATRPERADARRSRRLLLQAGFAAFSEGGFDVAVSDITTRAGLAKGTFFRHFPTKEDLAAALVAEEMAELTRLADAFLARHTAPLDAFLEAAALSLLPLRVIVERSILQGIVRPVIDEATTGLLTRLDALTARAAERGEVREDVVGFDVFLVLMGSTRTVYLPGAAGDPDDLWRRQLALALGGLRPAAGQPPLPGPVPQLGRPSETPHESR
jgi:AcrR family transcriptional regulator